MEYIAIFALVLIVGFIAFRALRSEPEAPADEPKAGTGGGLRDRSTRPDRK